MSPLSLYPFLNEDKLLRLLVPVALAGLIPLADFYLLFRFSTLIGTYITLMIITFSSLIGIALSVFILLRQQRTIRSFQEDGILPINEYNGMLGSLVLSLLWILPGITGKVLGLGLFIPTVRIVLGRLIAAKLEIDWNSFYEYIKVFQARQ